ncbi:MAG: hypothetical protein O3A14_11800 [Cyanobacteria bacterium]|nr:hypothetical protein [Cyanobacteriota bacterium]
MRPPDVLTIRPSLITAFEQAVLAKVQAHPELCQLLWAEGEAAS